MVTHNGPYDDNPSKSNNALDITNKEAYDKDAVTTSEDMEVFKILEDTDYKIHPEKLKSLAYQAQKNKQLDSALGYYKKIFRSRPSYGQSFRDLANAYVENGDYDRAWRLYFGYLVNHDISKKEVIGEIIYNEMEWLYFNRQKAANIFHEFVPSHSTKKDFERDVRIVIEWNTSEAEFNLEFVNPKDQVYTFQHTLAANENLIEDEKIKGYSSKEFSIPRLEQGDWLINLTYFGNKKLDPTYFKVTAYFDWGRSNQSQEVRLFRLEKTDIKYQLLKYNKNSVDINY
ncbi:hypothetical protein [Croceiramulus getboli]|nr:hypothetical protein P8624_01960 [Flavobacteriaceae bacterium YJPT1-3]